MMTIEQLIQLLANQGFAVAVAVYLLVLLDRRLRQLDERLGRLDATIHELHDCVDRLAGKLGMHP